MHVFGVKVGPRLHEVAIAVEIELVSMNGMMMLRTRNVVGRL